MLHNLGESGSVSLRNNGENQSFCEVVYRFHIPSAIWCICDIHHLRQQRENGATSVHIIIYIYIYHGYAVYSAYIQPENQGQRKFAAHMPRAEGEGHIHCKLPMTKV